MTSIVNEIKALCKDLKDEAEFMENLAGNAGKDRWPAVDPGYAKLRGMARIQADIVLVKAQALRDAVPD